MHLIICNERLLFRFGVDRVLLLLATRLRQAGWKITFISQRADLQVLHGITPHCITPPAHSGPYIELDQATGVWLHGMRNELIASGNAHGTVVLIGGWPFYSAIPAFRAWGVPVVALDCGAVPTLGMRGEALVVQEALRALRREYLPEAQIVTPISHFIERTQSRRDAGPDVVIETIHLGSDHLCDRDQSTLWHASDPAAGWPQGGAGPRIINLGRWETGNYKNSEAIFPIARRIITKWPDARIGVLATKAALDVPSDLARCIVPLGHPGDDQLMRLMQQADLGLSVSRWEGFNLPLAEMQQLGKPVLALDIGAHPEVAAHPWQLCRDEVEMAEKTLQYLAGDQFPAAEWDEAIAHFRNRFTWDHTVEAYRDLLSRLTPVQDPHWPQLVVDASACLRDPANTGVARVVRSLSRKLQDFGRPLFVAWDEQLQAYVLPTEGEYNNLARYGGPDPSPRHYALPRSQPHRRLQLGSVAGSRLRGSWLLQGEIVFERHGPRRRAEARKLGLKLAAIFYDAIPVTHPQWVADAVIRDNHAAYMRGLAECDLVLPISPASAIQLHLFWRAQSLRPQTPAAPCWIAGELSAAPRAAVLPQPPKPGQPLRLLCVSTLEPRKNHKTLLTAMQSIVSRYPQLNWELHLIGNRYAGGDAIVAEVTRASAQDPRIIWHGVVDDATLNQHYAQAHLTIYPSLVEGYGMPIVESLWHGRPSICHNAGVMAELAAQGGCQTVDMADPVALADTIITLAGDAERYHALAEQALERHILTWRGYARAMLTQIARHRAPKCLAPLPGRWQDLLVPPAVADTPDDELLALAALVHMRAVRCSLVLGETAPTMLALLGSLVPQAWQCRHAADIATVGQNHSVSQVAGPIDQILPLTLQALAHQGWRPDLVLLSAEAASDPRWLDSLAASDLNECLLIVPQQQASTARAALGPFAGSTIALAGYTGFIFSTCATSA